MDYSLISLVQCGQRVGGSFFLLLQVLGLVGSLDDQEKDQRGQQELNHNRGKADKASHKTGTAVFHLRQGLENRVQEDLHHSGDDLVERRAQDHGNRQIQDITLHCEILELFQQLLHFFSSSVYLCITTRPAGISPPAGLYQETMELISSRRTDR